MDYTLSIEHAAFSFSLPLGRSLSLSSPPPPTIPMVVAYIPPPFEIFCPVKWVAEILQLR